MNDSDFVNNVIEKLEGLLTEPALVDGCAKIELSSLLEMAYERNHTALVNKEDEAEVPAPQIKLCDSTIIAKYHAHILGRDGIRPRLMPPNKYHKDWHIEVDYLDLHGGVCWGRGHDIPGTRDLSHSEVIELLYKEVLAVCHVF